MKESKVQNPWAWAVGSFLWLNMASNTSTVTRSLTVLLQVSGLTPVSFTAFKHDARTTSRGSVGILAAFACAVCGNAASTTTTITRDATTTVHWPPPPFIFLCTFSQTPVYSATQPNGHKHRTESFLFFCFQNYYSRHSNKKKKASTERHRELPKKKTHYTKIKNLFQRNITDNISHIFLKNKQTANSEHFTSPLRYRVYYYYYYYYYYYHFLVLWVMWVYLKELHKKWAKHRNVWQKKEAQAQREKQTKMQREERKKERKLRERGCGLTHPRAQWWM